MKKDLASFFIYLLAGLVIVGCQSKQNETALSAVDSTALSPTEGGSAEAPTLSATEIHFNDSLSKEYDKASRIANELKQKYDVKKKRLYTLSNSFNVYEEDGSSFWQYDSLFHLCYKGTTASRASGINVDDYYCYDGSGIILSYHSEKSDDWFEEKIWIAAYQKVHSKSRSGGTGPFDYNIVASSQPTSSMDDGYRVLELKGITPDKFVYDSDSRYHYTFIEKGVNVNGEYEYHQNFGIDSLLFINLFHK